ncbi:ATP-dependent DNA helicase Q-like 3 [Cardamine amara subsp. amara]|uniref:ATP-dependent DNA helicase Q-like 3 n=1 Tax=Cardamine amara subsp. amara TaxID=228776 RepID=A0ABD0ZZ95_CARAN
MANERRSGGDTVAIFVRTIYGESTTVHVSSAGTIHDLKIALKSSFPSASSSPNFCLCFKGAKLSSNSRVDAITINGGDFLVMVPFVKKECSQTPQPDLSKPSLCPSISNSAFSQTIRKHSTLKDENAKRAENHFVGEKRKRDEETCPYGFFNGSDCKDAFKGQNTAKLSEVLKSRNCLTSPRSAKCLMSWDTSSSLCSCPDWVKMSMETFTFLNLFSSLIESLGEKLYITRLKESLSRLAMSGVRVGIQDVKNLSVICPKVVKVITDVFEAANYENAIVIADYMETDEKSGRKKTPLAKVFTAMKKREASFKSELWESIKSLLVKNTRESGIGVSLKDMLIFAREGRVGGGNEARQTGKENFPFFDSRSSKTWCHDTKSLLPSEMVEHLRNGIGSKGQIVHVEVINSRKAAYVELSDKLSETTKSALKRIGLNALYSHQAESISAALSGKNVVIATMTSSGKSLCYNVPVFEELCKDTDSCALYLFPTKALAQDQLRALSDLIKGHEESINMGVYDGDTPYKDRSRLRSNARLLITNPDMLHMSILPQHGQFSRILSNLRYVVIDEAHTYKGPFGCHTALILRRLRRLCSHVYGVNPSFIFCTATSANPREHCMELANLSELELIENDGSPSSEKLFVLWNPSVLPTSKPEKSLKVTRKTGAAADDTPSSPASEVSHLFAEMVQHGLRCIAFCPSRKLCELVLCLTREILTKTAPHLVEAISSYRGGYIAEDRRKIESDLFGGKLCGIAATNALELGIDVGHIDVTLHLGFPGSIASLWQQAGRSGRRQRPSLAVYVAFEGPLDQYFMKFPNKLFRSPIECCHIDSQNEQVLVQHLACAALEHPLSLEYDGKHFGSGINNALELLKKRGFLSFDPSRNSSARIWTYIGREKKFTQRVSIRAIETVRYRIMEKKSKDLLDEIEESKAFFQVYEGAVYMNQGRTYLVTSLDTKEKIAFCEFANVDYYTRTRDYTDIQLTGGNTAYALKAPKNQLNKTTAQTHSCRVTTHWLGFYRIRKSNYNVIDDVDLLLPSYSYQSQAVWIQVPVSVKSKVDETCFSFREGLHAACHALLHVVPLFVRCNYSDLAPECPNPQEKRYFPARILLYDHHPGGTGISTKIRPFFTELLEAALDLLTSCWCSGESGCPSCVQNFRCQGHNELLHKRAAIMIIQGVLEAEKSYFEEES